MLACTGKTQDTGTELEIVDSDGDGVIDSQDCAPEDPAKSQNLSLMDDETYGPSDLVGLCEQYCELRVNRLIGSDDSLLPLSCLVGVGESFRYSSQTSAGITQLSRLREVDGRFELQSKGLSSLEGLDALERVGSLSIDAPKLESLEGLEQLRDAETIGVENLNAVDLRGLSGLESVEILSLYSFELDSLKGLDALKNLEEIQLSGKLGSFDGFPSHLDLSAVYFSGMEIDSFSMLAGQSLLGLGLYNVDFPEEIKEQLPAAESILFESLRLRSFSDIDMSKARTLIVERCAVEFLDVESLAPTMTILYLRLNDELLAIDGPAGVTEIELVEFKSNPQLTRISGFPDLKTATNVFIEDNDSLTDLSGLHGVESVYLLYIARNPELSNAEIDSLIGAIGEENIESIYVSDNGE
jgi:hypothetical protein